MSNKKFLRKFNKVNKNGALTLLGVIALTFTQVPGAIKNAAEVICIGQASNKIWKIENNHSEANMLAVQRCNGRN